MNIWEEYFRAKIKLELLELLTNMEDGHYTKEDAAEHVKSMIIHNDL